MLFPRGKADTFLLGGVNISILGKGEKKSPTF